MSWFSNLFKRRHEEDDQAAYASDIATVQWAEAKVPARAKERLPRFHGTAGDKVRPRGGGGLEQLRLRLRTAFTPSRPVVKPAMFAGRTMLLRSLIRSVEDQQLHVILFGARGIGKTSTLHILTTIAQEARYVVRYSSCGEDTNFDELFRAVLDEIPLLFHANYEPTADEIEEGLTFSSLITDAPLTVAQVSDLFSKISGTRVLIVLDEFDRANAPNFRRSIAELIKNLSDRASRVQLVIAGVASNVNELIEHIPSIRRNILALPLPMMAEEEVVELIRNGETASGLVYSDDAVGAICDVAHGLPYLTSLISQHAGIAALDRRQTVVAGEHVEAAVVQAFSEIELRTSAVTRHHISQAIFDGLEQDLELLTRAALGSGGRILADSTAGGAGISPATIERLESQYQLIEPIVADPAGAYMFSDEGAPIYLWMRRASRAAPETWKVTALPLPHEASA